MFGPTRYIDWATKFYGKVPFDLATSGIPLVATSELLTAAEIRNGDLDLDDPSSSSALRSAIARYNDVPLAEVREALGTSHGIFLAYAAMLEPGDEILVEAPGYEPMTRCAEGLGAIVRTFPRRAEDAFAVDPEIVSAALSPKTRVVVVSSLHNPSGIRVSDAAIRALSKLMAARGGWVLVDEVYAPFDDLPVDGVFRRSARKLAANVVCVGSLTKCYGLGMFRIGWVLGPEALVARGAHAAIATLGHLPQAHAALGAAAFRALPKLSLRARTMLGEKRLLAERWVNSLPNAQWSAPREGLFGLVTLPGRGDLRERIEDHALTSGVLVGAGTFFGAPESFRLSWASYDSETFEATLARLRPLVE